MLAGQFASLMLLLWGYSARTVARLCDLRGRRCICSVDALSNVINLMPCLLAAELEIQDGSLEGIDPQLFPELQHLHMLPVQTLAFTRVTISQGFLSALIFVLPYSNVKELVFARSTLKSNNATFMLPSDSVLSGIRLDNVTLSPALLHPAGQPLHLWLLGAASGVAVVRAGISEIDCEFARLLTNLTDLDLSENELKDGFLDLARCRVTFPRLDCLRLNGNRLRSFQHLCLLLQGVPALQDLHASRNNFSQPPSGCSLGDRSFRVLNLSRTELVQVTPYLPRSVDVLDLSGNNLQHFDSLPRGLRRLHLSDNRLLTLPAVTGAPRLSVLEVDGNRLTGLWDESGPGTDPLQVLEQLVAFRAGRNPYNCSCGARDTVDRLRRESAVMKDWPGDYMCSTPLSLKGTLLKDLRLSFYKCNHTAAVCLISLSVLAVVVLIAMLIGCRFYRAASGRPFSERRL